MAAAAAQREAMNAARNVSEEQLLDVLYEVLAQGTDPGEKLTRGEVESFLHAHARSKKPVSEILAFFAQHKLPLDAEAYAADPALGQLASGIHRERGPSSSLFAIEQVEPPDDAGEARETLADTPTNRNKLPVVPMVAPVAAETSGLKARATQPWADARALRYAALGFGFVLVAGLALSMRHSAALESELQAARLQQRTTDAALTALEQRAEGLRSEVARREQEQQQLSQRFHEFVADQAKEQAAAETALKSLLGARYDTLRMRALAAETAVVPTR